VILPSRFLACHTYFSYQIRQVLMMMLIELKEAPGDPKVETFPKYRMVFLFYRLVQHRFPGLHLSETNQAFLRALSLEAAISYLSMNPHHVLRNSNT